MTRLTRVGDANDQQLVEHVSHRVHGRHRHVTFLVSKQLQQRGDVMVHLVQTPAISKKCHYRIKLYQLLYQYHHWRISIRHHGSILTLSEGVRRREQVRTASMRISLCSLDRKFSAQ